MFATGYYSVLSLTAYKMVMNGIWFSKNSVDTLPPFDEVSNQTSSFINIYLFVSIISEKRPEFCGFYQQDAHEFLTFLITTLHGELRSFSTKIVETLHGDDIRFVSTFDVNVVSLCDFSAFIFPCSVIEI